MSLRIYIGVVVWNVCVCLVHTPQQWPHLLPRITQHNNHTHIRNTYMSSITQTVSIISKAFIDQPSQIWSPPLSAATTSSSTTWPSSSWSTRNRTHSYLKQIHSLQTLTHVHPIRHLPHNHRSADPLRNKYLLRRTSLRIKQHCSKGFFPSHSEKSLRSALERTNYNMDDAITLLLEQPMPLKSRNDLKNYQMCSLLYCYHWYVSGNLFLCGTSVEFL